MTTTMGRTERGLAPPQGALPGDEEIAASLQRELLRYCERKMIRSGPIFVTRSGTGVDRSNFWRRLQKLAPIADVDPVKLHPHNLRHYFARMYYKETHDLAGLADLLGHSSINVTRIYTAEDGTWYHIPYSIILRTAAQRTICSFARLFLIYAGERDVEISGQPSAPHTHVPSLHKR